VGQQYFSKHCPQWKKFVIADCKDKFHSCSDQLSTLGVVKVSLKFKHHEFIIDFVVIENSVVNYFIIGNDYLSHFKISIMNDNGSYFRIGSENFKHEFVKDTLGTVASSLSV
jgi:hypothetical protein